MRPLFVACLLLLYAVATTVFAQSGTSVMYTAKNTVYQQDFNALPNTGNFSLTGKGPFDLSQSPFSIAALPGWSFMQKAGTAPNALFAVGIGSSTAAGIYSVGAAGSTDRALGLLAAGTGVYAMGIRLTNATGSSLNTVTGSVTVEQWRKGGSGNRNSLNGKYALGLIDGLDHPNLNNHPSLQISSVQFSAGAGSLNGNSSENQTTIQFSITGIEWKNGEQLLLRWDDTDESGSDDLIAIDQFSIKADYDTSKNSVPIEHLLSQATNPSNADTIQYWFKAGGDITGLSAANFALLTEGINNAAITKVAGSGSDYLIQVYTGTGEGKMVLGIQNNQNLVPGLSGLPFFSIDTQRIDKIKPALLNWRAIKDSIFTTNDTLTLAFNFSEPVSLDTSMPSPEISIQIGSTVKQASYWSGNLSNQLTFRYIVTAADLDSDGIGLASDFNLNSLGIRDLAENTCATGWPSLPIQPIKIGNPIIQFVNTKDTFLLQCNHLDSIDIAPVLQIEKKHAGANIIWEVLEAPNHWQSPVQSVPANGQTEFTQPNQWKWFSNKSYLKDSMLIRVTDGHKQAVKKILLQSISWLGTADSSWQNPLNWCNAVLPKDSATIVIPPTAKYMPILSGVQQVNQLHIKPGAVLQITGTLKISGQMYADSASVIATEGSIELNGQSSQSINGHQFKAHTLNNLSIQNASGVELTQPLRMQQHLNMRLGSLQTNDQLYFLSGAAISSAALGTSIVGRIHAANIYANKTAGTYLVGHPFNANININQWTNKPNLYYLDGSIATDSFSIESGWQPFQYGTDSLGGLWKKQQVIQWRIPTTQTVQSAQPFISGPIELGNQTIALNGKLHQFNLVSNPYLSPIQTNAIGKSTGVRPYKYIWNPTLGQHGGYTVLPFSQHYVLNPFEAFIVQTDSSSENALIFTEAVKSIEWNKGLIDAFKEENGFFANIQFRFQNQLQDQLLIREQSGSRNGLDQYDAIKLKNPGMNLFSRSTDGYALAVDSRLFSEQTMIPIELHHAGTGQYQFQIADAFMPSGYALVLYDTYTNQYLPLIKDSGYAFTITADSLSQNKQRFYIGKLIPKATLPLLNWLTVKLFPNPAKHEIKLFIKAAERANCWVKIFNTAGTLLQNIELGNIKEGQVSIPISTLPNGQYLLQLNSGGHQQTLQFFKQ